MSSKRDDGPGLALVFAVLFLLGAILVTYANARAYTDCAIRMAAATSAADSVAVRAHVVSNFLLDASCGRLLP